MGSDEQGVECDVGLGLGIQQIATSLPFQISSSGFGDAHDVVEAQTSSFLNYDLAFKSQVPIGGPFSFTKVQWQELERQTVVYKFLSASIPVPPQLLMPINTNPGAAHPDRKFLFAQSDNLDLPIAVLADVYIYFLDAQPGLFNFGIPSNIADQEPWRCRRTDGKKWRCSRDVVPDQKYCERHAHKNRPRSRKHVEIHAPTIAKKKNRQLEPKASSSSAEPRSQIFAQNAPQLRSYSTLSSYDQPRCQFNLFAKGSTTLTDSGSQQWMQIMQPKDGFTQSQSNIDVNAFKHQKDTLMSLNGMSVNFGSEGHSPKVSFPNEDMSLEQTERPIGFIDAWSTVNGGDMAKYSGTSLVEAEQDTSGLHPVMNWMSAESWISSVPGGPLAEALCLGISSNGKSPHAHRPYLCSSNTAYTQQPSFNY